MTTMRAWLEGLGLDQYLDVFERNEIDIAVVPDLTNGDLQELSVPLGHRKKLLKAAARLNDRTDSDPLSGASSSYPTAETGERRQLTVMFCDMVGFTELASRLDPEILRNIIRVYEDTCAAAITRYDGYVFQRLGDGIVAFFGYPLAHEGEAERAIRAGLDIIDTFAGLEVPEVKRLQVRIGIATGIVVVSSAEKGAVGETMNLASRLQGIAQVNTIAVSERVKLLAGGAFDYKSLGEQTLKGIARSTRAYAILGVSEAGSRFEAAQGEGELTPLVGRDLELGLLMDRWALAQDGEGQVVLLGGEPGIGKSRILSALRAKLESEDAIPMRFQCSPYYVNSAFWPSIDHFERVLKLARDEPPESKLDKLESLIVGHCQRSLKDVRFVATMLSIPCDQRYGELAMTPQKFKDETLRTLVDLTEAAANIQPSVLLFEDLHWADPTTLEVLDLMIDRAKTIPLLIVLTHRPEFQNRWANHGHVSALNLSKLTRSQSSAMVSRVAGGKALPDDLHDQILARTDGVPLFVEELTKSILESGELVDKGDHYDYSGTSQQVTIPATLRDSLMARLDRYMPVKEIAQIGAAIGREFSYELVSAVAPLPKNQLDDALAQLTVSGLAFRRGTPPQASYTFKHALVQDAAYDSLLKSRRHELHGKIAKVIKERFPQTGETEPEVLAHHLTAAGEAAAAIPLWRQAGELAFKRMALKEAISHLDQGLGLITTLPKSRQRDTGELALRVPLGMAWMALKGWGATEVWSSHYPALALAKTLKDNDALLAILLSLQSNIQSQGRITDAFRWAEEILDTAKATKAPEQLIAAHDRLGVVYFWMGRLVESMEHGDKALALQGNARGIEYWQELLGDPKISTGLFGSQAAWMLGYPDRAVQRCDETLAYVRRFGHPFNLGWTLRMGAEVFVYRGEPEEARKRSEECERLGKEHSLPVLVVHFAPSVSGLALIRESKFAKGISRLNAALAASDASRLRNPYYKAVLGEGTAMLGRLDEALQLIEDAIEDVEGPDGGERIHYAEILRLKGWMLTLKDDLAGAEKHYFASLDWARGQQARSWELRTSTSLARLWQQQGKCNEAHDLLAPVYGWFTEGFDTRDLKEAKALLEELAA